MLLKTSISSTKKFFKRTIQSFKSLLSNGYEKLPKTPPLNPFSCAEKNLSSQSYRDMDTFYADFTNQWDRDKAKAVVKRSESNILISTRKNETRYDNSMEFAKAKGIIGKERKRVGGNHDEFSSGGYSRVVREERGCLVTRKLKELEMMDASNIEHVLDIEEVLHYYSRITCPVYIDLVDKYFMEMYSELFNLKATTKF